MRVLLVEDSKRLQTYISIALKNEGIVLDVTGDGAEGLYYAQSFDYDLIILDIMLPGMDGMTILQKLREEGNETHVLFLTAKETVEDRVLGLQKGADDYLVKPFAIEELIARVQALIRRSHDSKKTKFLFGDISVDLVSRVVVKAGKHLELPPREFAILEYLIMTRDRIVSRTEIEEHIYDSNAELMSNVIDSAICSIRKKLDTPGRPSIIKTRRGIGYELWDR